MRTLLALLPLLLLPLAAIAAGAAGNGSSAASSSYDNVNVFIGSGGFAFGYGSVSPSAQVPFGAMRLGPDTTMKMGDVGFQHFSGYDWVDDTIRAFSHTHLVGAGINDLGNFGVMPFTLRGGTMLENSLNFWWSTFAKESESGSPGIYKVHLNEPKVDVELIALSNMAGLHRYTWTTLEGQVFQQPGLIIDPCHAAKLDTDPAELCKNASVTIDPENPSKFHAAVSFNGYFTRGMWMYLSGELVVEHSAAELQDWKMCSGERLNDLDCASTNFRESTAGKLYAVQNFKVDKTTIKRGSFSVQLRVGLSFISAEMADRNLADALSETDNVDKLRARTKSLWSDYLDRLQLQALDGDQEITPMLHSALYRTLLSPTDYTEADGLYRGADKQVHNATLERSAAYGNDLFHRSGDLPARFFSDLSFWDTFRTLHPWQLLFSEPLAVGVARSVGEITVQQGAFPRWILGSQETGCMMGLSGSAFTLEAALAGLQSQFDLPAIQRQLLAQSTQNVPLNGRQDVDFYLSNGYVSQDAADDSTALTLTFAFDDYLLGKISELVGDTASAEAALQRSKNYRNLWSPEKQYFCPKYKSGEQVCPLSPSSYASWSYFREGDALHYLFFVPHDVPGLMSLWPSLQDFDADLTIFMDEHVAPHEKYGSAVPNPYYWAGNEHDHLSPFLFNFGANCTKTQYWARRLTEMHFSNTPHGDPGNEDYGAMSSWLLYTSLGLFPLSGTSTLLIGSPRVVSASVRLTRWQAAEDTLLSIVTHNNSQDNVYVERVLINGRALTSPFVDRSELVSSSTVTLEFFMTSEPKSDLCRA